MTPFQQHKNYQEKLSTKNQKDNGKELKPYLENTETAQKLEKAPPTNYLEHIYLGIGIALYNQKKYEEALLYFKKSIEVKDTFLSGYQWIDYAETSLLEQKEKQNQKEK